MEIDFVIPDLDEKQLWVYDIVIDALKKQSDVKEAIDQLPK